MEKWVPHELNESRKTEKPLAKCCSPGTKESHFSIVTGDEKWIYFENPKRKRSWVTPDESSTSTSRPNYYGWKTILSHAAYSPDLAPSNYHLFASMGHTFAQQRFTSYEYVRKWLNDWFGSKEQLFWHGIHKLSNR